MGERKIVSKYYPADFDPAKIPRRRQPMNKQIKVRMMLPMTIRCTRCTTFIYKGTKFNTKKETVVDENYRGINIVRFYMKCTKCSSEITYKTDPRNSDYRVEFGAWHQADKEEKRNEEVGDATKSLETKASSMKRQMDDDAALLEMKSLKHRHAALSEDAKFKVLQRRSDEAAKKRKLAEEEEDEALIRDIFHQRPKKPVLLRRVDDDDLEDSAYTCDDDDDED